MQSWWSRLVRSNRRLRIQVRTQYGLEFFLEK
jgi:hypothetical protein